MKGDFTRFSHQPSQNYAGVLMQQGRVTLDADWNEQFDIEDHRWRVQTIDTIGRACAPVDAAGFSISFTPDGSDLIIGEGRIYVDGILVENRHGTWVDLVDVIDDDGERRGVVADFTPDGAPFEEGQWIELGWAGGTAVGQVTATDPGEGSISAVVADGPDGIPADLRVRRLVTYLTQPFYRAEAAAPFGDPFTPREWDGQRHILYLDVWRRHVTAIEDPHIREVALGGPDTATRVQTAWAVRVLFDGDDPVDGTDLGCHDPLDVWDELTAPKAGRMTARAEAVDDPDDPCAIQPEAGYRGLENRLYRVEIHDPGPLGTATFKWSRDNGSILSRIVDFPDADEIQLHSLGRDRVLRFGADDQVEVLSDESEFAGLPGTTAAVVGQPDEAERILTLDTDVSTYQSHHTPRVRRWDQGTGPIPTAGTFTELEDGVQVAFSDGPFSTGDYWVVPARVATGDVDGFVDASPRGVHHHFARLALVTWSDAVTDCRRTFPSLCGLPTGGGEHCATVTVGDGVTSSGDFTSIQEAVDSVPTAGPARVSILPGTYVLGGPVQVSHARLTISGCDDQTRIVAPQTSAFVLSRCAEVRLERLRIEGNDRRGAVVVAESSEVAIVRCTVVNGARRDGGPGPDGFVAAFAPRTTTLSADFEPAGPALAVHGTVWLWVLTNRLLGGPAVSLQAVAATVRDNTLRHGGVWVRDGSSVVTVNGNHIQGGAGPGVAIGGFAPDEDLSRRSTGVRFVDIAHNRILGTGQSGITTVHGSPPRDEDRDPVVVVIDRFRSVDVAGKIGAIRGEIDDLASVRYARPEIADDLVARVVAIPAIGDVESVAVVGNSIVGCATDPPDPRLDPEATGGVVLRDSIGARIVDNEIVDNGAGGRAVGVFLAGCDATEIQGNRIRDNGSGEGRHADFVPGGDQEGPNPLVVRQIEFQVPDADSTTVLPLFGLLVRRGLRVTTPVPVRHVCFTYLALGPVRATALDESGAVVAEAMLDVGLQTLGLESDDDFVIVQFELDPVSDTVPTMSLLAFCAGEGCRFYQGGVIGVDLAVDGAGPTVALHGNDVTTPAGQALLLTGVGSMLVSDNRLLSEGDTLQSCAVVDHVGQNLPPSLLPKTVLVYDAGQSILLGNQTVTAGRGTFAVGDLAAEAPVTGLGGNVMFERSARDGPTMLVDSLVARVHDDPDGRVLFHGNQATYRPAAARFVPWSIALVSFDDVAILDNQIAAEAPGGVLLTDLVAIAPLLRAADNAIVEPILNAAFSAIVQGFLAHATGNQATHCIRVVGLVDERVDNQIVLAEVLPEYCRQLEARPGGIPSSLAAVFGGGD